MVCPRLDVVTPFQNILFRAIKKRYNFGMTEFFETHAHCDFSEFEMDRRELWQRCQLSGVQHLIIPSVDLSRCKNILTLCDQYSGWYFGCGVHPWWIEKQQEKLIRVRNELLELGDNEQCVAIGETGLDGHISCPMNTQKSWFEMHIHIARELNKPLIIHSVKAHSEVIALLKKYPSVTGVIHGFSGSEQIAQSYCNLGFYLGVGGTITYDRAEKTRRAIQGVPLDKLILETDSPAMPLCGQQGERNTPLNIPVIASCLAKIKDCSLEQIAAVTTQNAKHLFGVTDAI